MTTLSPGDHVTLTIGGRLYRGTVLYVRDGTVRVEVPGRKPVTRPIARVKRVETATTWVSRTADDPAALIAAGVCEVTHVDHEKRTVTVDLVPYLRPVPKPPKPLRSDAYLVFVRKHACCAPGCRTPRDRVEAHHFGPHGLSVKCDDFRTVPLCHTCHHAEFHTKGVLRGCNREETERMFTIAMRELLMEWFGTERDGGERDAVIVDALIARIRESNQ